MSTFTESELEARFTCRESPFGVHVWERWIEPKDNCRFCGLSIKRIVEATRMHGSTR